MRHFFSTLRRDKRIQEKEHAVRTALPVFDAILLGDKF